MSRIRNLVNRLRAWRLNRWADTMTKEARYHEREARHHRAAASHYTEQASSVRALARRVEAAGQT